MKEEIMRKKHNGVHKESTNAPTYRSKLILVTRNIDYLILGIFKRDVGKKRPKAWWFVRVRYTENDSVFDIPIKEWEAGRRPKKYKNNRYFIMEQSRSKGYVVLDAKFGYRPDGTEQEQKNAIREWWVLVKDREFLTNIWKRNKGISRGVKLISLDEEASVIVNEASNKYPNDYICSSAIHGHKRYPGSWSVVIQHRFTQTCFLYPLSEWRRGKLPIIPIGFEKEVTIDPDYSFMGIVSLGTKGKPLKCALARQQDHRVERQPALGRHGRAGADRLRRGPAGRGIRHSLSRGLLRVTHHAARRRDAGAASQAQGSAGSAGAVRPAAFAP